MPQNAVYAADVSLFVYMTLWLWLHLLVCLLFTCSPYPCYFVLSFCLSHQLRCKSRKHFFFFSNVSLFPSYTKYCVYYAQVEESKNIYEKIPSVDNLLKQILCCSFWYNDSSPLKGTGKPVCEQTIVFIVVPLSYSFKNCHFWIIESVSWMNQFMNHIS